MSKEQGNYERRSHTHCMDQTTPPCGMPLEKHTQCCLCDVKVEEKEEKKINWREELFEKIPSVINSSLSYRNEKGEWIVENRSEVADFIEKTLESQRSHILAMIEEMRKPDREVAGGYILREWQHNEAIDMIISKIKEKL